jgi:HEAT repeat protein
MLAKRQRKLLLTLAFVVGGIFLAVWLWPSNEPSYHGKSLSKWLDDLRIGPPGQTNLAFEAIRAIGTNALPYLNKMMSLKRSPQRVAFYETINDVVRNRLRWRKDYIVDPIYPCLERAMIGYMVLGASASNAVPSLIRLLNEPEVGQIASYALTGIGAPAAPALAEVLTNGTRKVRIQIAGHVYRLGTNADLIVPALLVSMEDEEFEVRDGAAAALLQLEPSIAVPALTEALNNSNHSVRFRAVQGLGKLGSFATDSAPAVARLLTDPNPIVRTEASNTLRILTGAASQ